MGGMVRRAGAAHSHSFRSIELSTLSIVSVGRLRGARDAVWREALQWLLRVQVCLRHCQPPADGKPVRLACMQV